LLPALVRLVDRHGFACATPLRSFHAFLRTGCSETEAANWLKGHIEEFPLHLRDTLMAQFADGTFEEAEEESVRGMTDDEVSDRVTEVLKREGVEAAREWLSNARRR
jgi:hypothetical protein